MIVIHVFKYEHNNSTNSNSSYSLSKGRATFSMEFHKYEARTIAATKHTNTHVHTNIN